MGAIMRVELIIGAAGFVIAVAIILGVAVLSDPFGRVISEPLAVIPEPLATAIGFGALVAVMFALYIRSIWRGPYAALTFGALMILTSAVMAGIDSGPLAVAGNVAMVAAILAALAVFGVCFAWGLNKIYETNDPRFQIIIPILLFGVLALSVWQGLWQGSRLWFPAVIGFGTLIMFCFELWQLMKRKRAA
jgi:hypothetical protein